MALPARIQTPRLTLDPVRPGMAAAMADALADPRVSFWLARVPHPYGLADAQAFIAAARRSGRLSWAVLQGGRFCGMVGLEGHLGFWLIPELWGKGLMAEAAGAVLAQYFADPDAPPLTSGYFAGNDRSAALLRRLGFAPRGALHPVRCLSQARDLPHQDMVLAPEQWHLLNPPRIAAAGGLFLRPLTGQDAPALCAALGRVEVAPMLTSVPLPWSEAAARAWIERGRWRGRVGFRLGICAADGALIGVVGLGGTPVTCMYALDPAHWGRGHATAAMRAFLDWCFARFGLDAVQADHFDDNPASGRVLQKLGFRRAGQDRGGSAARLEPAAKTLYRLTRREWKAAIHEVS